MLVSVGENRFLEGLNLSRKFVVREIRSELLQVVNRTLAMSSCNHIVAILSEVDAKISQTGGLVIAISSK